MIEALCPAAGSEAKAAAEFGSRPLDVSVCLLFHKSRITSTSELNVILNCVQLPVYSISIENSIFPEMSVTTLLHSHDELSFLMDYCVLYVWGALGRDPRVIWESFSLNPLDFFQCLQLVVEIWKKQTNLEVADSSFSVLLRTAYSVSAKIRSRSALSMVSCTHKL